MKIINAMLKLAQKFTSSTADVNFPIVNNIFKHSNITPCVVSKYVAISSLENGESTG